MNDVTFRSTAIPRFFYGYVVTAAGFWSWFIGWGSYTFCFGVFLKPLVAHFGWTRAEVSLAYALFFLVQAIMGIIMGWLTDRIGPRLLVLVFGSFLGISYLLMPLMTCLWHFYLLFALLGGIGASILLVPIMVTISRWFVKKRGFMTGIVQSGISFGGLFFPPFAGWLIQNHGWRTAYTTLGIISLSGIFLSGLFIRRDPAEMGLFPDGMDTDPAPISENRHSEKNYAGPSLGAAFRMPQFWLILGIFAAFGFCRSTFNAHIAAHVQDLGFSLTDGANVMAVIALSSLIGRVGMGRLADVIGNRPALGISFASTGLILLWCLFAGHLWQLYLFAAVFGFGWGAQAVLRFAVTSEAFGLVSLGLILGVLAFGESLAAMIGSYLGGFLFDLSGSYAVVFWIGLALSAAGFVFTWGLKTTPVRQT